MGHNRVAELVANPHRKIGGDALLSLFKVALLMLSTTVVLYVLVVSVISSTAYRSGTLATPLGSKSVDQATVRLADLLIGSSQATVAAAVKLLKVHIPEPQASFLIRSRTRAGKIPVGFLHSSILILAAGVGGWIAAGRGVGRFAFVLPLLLLPISAGLLTHQALPTLQNFELWLFGILVSQCAAAMVGALMTRRRNSFL
jgi:hypothetical protein